MEPAGCNCGPDSRPCPSRSFMSLAVSFTPNLCIRGPQIDGLDVLWTIGVPGHGEGTDVSRRDSVSRLRVGEHLGTRRFQLTAKSYRAVPGRKRWFIQPVEARCELLG